MKSKNQFLLFVFVFLVLSISANSQQIDKKRGRDLGIPYSERTLDTFAPPIVSEAMLVGTGFGIVGVREFLPSPTSEPVQFNWPGPIFRRLLAAWSRLVGIEIDREFTT